MSAPAYDLSLVVAFATGAEPNYCYANAWHAITELPLLQDAHLIEGWIVLEQESQVALIEHCWCKCVDGLIVDPSIVLLVRKTHPVLYFSGIQRDRAEVEKLSCHSLPYVCSVGTYGPNGMGHADYRSAYGAAYAQARTSAAAHCPQKNLIVQPSARPLAEASLKKLAVHIGSSATFLRGEL